MLLLTPTFLSAFLTTIALSTVTTLTNKEKGTAIRNVTGSHTKAILMGRLTHFDSSAANNKPNNEMIELLNRAYGADDVVLNIPATVQKTTFWDDRQHSNWPTIGKSLIGHRKLSS